MKDQDMKSLLMIVEGKTPSTNRLSVAEQMITTQYSKPLEKKTKPPSIISKYINTINEEIQQAAQLKSNNARQVAIRIADKMLGESMPVSSIDNTGEDKVDTVTVDIPLLIRLLEYAREDAKTDMDLHNVSEKLIELSKEHSPLTMEYYDAIVGEQAQLPAPAKVSEGNDYCKVCGQTPCNCTFIAESTDQYVLFVNSKPSSTYPDERSAKIDIQHLKSKYPNIHVELRKETCKMDTVSEVSNELLTRYKKSASADATKADAEGNFEKGNKRFSGIVKATKKQFANDAKKHK